MTARLATCRSSSRGSSGGTPRWPNCGRWFGARRVLTLCGPGGAGKTRLAIALAEAMRPDFVGGAWWVDLSATLDSDLVPQVVAATVLRAGLTNDPAPAGPRASVPRVDAAGARQLRAGRRRVRRPDRRPCSRARQSLRVIATSRQPLGVPGEQVWRVAGLAIAEADPADQDARGRRHRAEAHDPDDGAVSLFIERAARGVEPVRSRCPRRARHDPPDLPVARRDAAADRARGGAGARAVAEPDRRTARAGRQRAAPHQPDGARAPPHPRRDARVEPPHARAGRAAAVPPARRVPRDVLAGGGRVRLRRLPARRRRGTRPARGADRPLARPGRRRPRRAALPAAGHRPPVRGRQAVGQRRRPDASAGGTRSSSRRWPPRRTPGSPAGEELRWLERLERRARQPDRGARSGCSTSRSRRGAQLASMLWPFWYQRGYYREARMWFEQTLARADEISPARRARHRRSTRARSRSCSATTRSRANT